MQDVQLAKEFLHNYLDQDIQDHIDWNTLAPYDGSLIGENSKQLHADIVLQSQYKKHQVAVFIILNHERKLTPMLPIRLLAYKLGTLKRSIKQKQPKPTFIIHITWYKGRQRPDSYAQSILDYFTEWELAKQLILNPSQIVHAHEVSEDSLERHEKTDILEDMQITPKLLEWIETHGALVRKLADNKYVDRTLEYVSEIGYHSAEELLSSFSKVSEKLAARMLTTV